MAPRTLAIAALAAIITTGTAHAQIPNAFAPQPQFYTGGIPNAAPPMMQYQPPPYVPPPPIPVAPMPSPYRVIVPSYGGMGGYH